MENFSKAVPGTRHDRNRSRYERLVGQIIACLAFLAILLTCCLTSAWAESPTKNVLLLFSGRFIAPLSITVDEAVRATFNASPSTKVELYSETLDVARFNPERY